MLPWCLWCCTGGGGGGDEHTDEPENVVIKPKITINCSCFRGAAINNEEKAVAEDHNDDDDKPTITIAEAR